MKWLFTLLATFKSELFAMVGVLAVCGIGTTIAGYLVVQKQNSQLVTKDTQIKELEAGNAQVREYMSRPIPADLRRLLEKQ